MQLTREEYCHYTGQTLSIMQDMADTGNEFKWYQFWTITMMVYLQSHFCASQQFFCIRIHLKIIFLHY